MRQIYKVYYRERGVRYADRLMNLPDTSLVEFPRLSLFHYVPGDTGSPEVDPQLSYFQGYSRKIELEYIYDYLKTEGGVRRPMFNMKESTRPFRRKNRQRWDVVTDAWKTNHNPESLQVLNYGYLDVVYKYLPLQMANYYRWLNRQRTVWAKVAEVAKASDRNQFIFFPIPANLQGRTILDKYTHDAVSIRMAEIFGQYDWAGFMQLDMWMWLNPETRAKSQLGVIALKDYPKVNLIFQGASGQQAIVNLAYLNSWIKGQPNMTEFGSLVTYSPVQMQKIFLKLCMTLNAMAVEEGTDGEVVVPTTNIVPSPVVKVEPTAENPEAATSEDDAALEKETTDLDKEVFVGDMEDESDGVEYRANLKPGVASKTNPKDLVELDPDKLESTSRPDLTSSLFDDLEKDMEALDILSLKQLKSAGIKMNAIDEQAPQEPAIDREAVKQKAFGAKAPVEVLKAWLDADAEANLLTAADYRKLNETVAKYQSSEDPYGSKKSRVEAMVIREEDVVLSKADSQIVTGDVVPDKAMANSSLLQFDRKYLKTVYKKDILRVVDSIQSAGVTIRMHEVDVTHSALGSYEHHKLEIKPVDGAPSTIQFTFPKVDEDGSFMAGGNKYLMRKGRRDLPIRKIAPRIVSLSTYYGKTFVQTNPKVVNDSLAWLYRKINEATMVLGGHIHDVNPGNVFDNDFVAPYLYNALANEYEQMKAGDLTLYFNHNYRAKTVNPELLKLIERNGRVWCGWAPGNTPIVIDKRNQFFKVTKQGETELGSIYDLLKLDNSKCPIDIAEVRIYSKFLPAGVVLAYYLGFQGLLTLLEVPYRTVEGRKQKNLEKDEYAITFKDESYIFKTGNPITTMILAGFNEFEKVIKLYDRKAFENKDVYLNLLMSKNIGAVYIRELDMMETAFIDPISREVLEMMKEPTTFIGLILRSCEMLATYHHPATIDRNAMRDCGYERFAGALYKELMQATRQFRNKNLVGRSKIDMSPYQVWNSIMKDSSLKIVEDTNPIQNLKESEVMTYAGAGGRDKDTMTKPTRAYHKSDLGILSESTVDNSGVGTIAYMSADPNIANIRGMAPKERNLSPTSILSTSALLSPASMNDN